MTEAVIDASALVDALTAEESNAAASISGVVLHAPHLIDIEVSHALRALERRGAVDTAVAATGQRRLLELITHRYGHELLLPRIWELRAAVRTSDAAYVALAEMLSLPLVTADEHLLRAAGPRCGFELV